MSWVVRRFLSLLAEFQIPMRGNEMRIIRRQTRSVNMFQIPMRGNEARLVTIGSNGNTGFKSP